MKYVVNVTIEVEGLTEEDFAESKRELGIDESIPIQMLSHVLHEKFQEHLDDMADAAVAAGEERDVKVTVAKFNFTLAED